MYDAAKIATRVGNEVSSPTEYLSGVWQGYPASPILFDFYINDIFTNTRGVRVPGLTLRITGLLFSDDAVLLAESSAELQTALNTITEWSDTWEMAVNASKCGLMTMSGDLTTDMTLQGQKVNSTGQYTYLGYIMIASGSFLGRSGTTIISSIGLHTLNTAFRYDQMCS
ncbi:RNA-directed DNA polymerase from mobile element jockey [Smittium culicis]|uniref:RNA-directed DNA polymerase from mobile element jockey n=1 Tax=Smittium culicis TaxID=133412 RepID=A0A1R1X7Q9_9FUNG|nr:RNA-directed DNA polymerase from mobile element jockey [Smittium culicis]